MPNAMPQKKRIAGGGSAPVTAGAAATSIPATAAAPAQASPGYVNFSRLLAVNQGGAQRMADSLAGKVQQQGQQAQGAIQGAVEKVGQAVQAGTLQYERSGLPGAAPNDPNAYREAGRVAGQRAAQGYQGPKDWAGAGVDVAGLTSQATAASQAAKNLTTAGGRGAMLREQAGGPYSAGMSTLDAALSGAALGGRGRDLATTYGNLAQQLADARAASDTQSAAAQATSADAAQRYGKDAEDWNQQADALAMQQDVERRLQQGLQGIRGLRSRFLPQVDYTQNTFLGFPLSKHPRKEGP